MGFLDLINELRKGKPDVKKAAKAMKVIGWVCFGVVAWNLIIFAFEGPNKSPIDFAPEDFYAFLTGTAVAGILFLFASKGIKEMESWGKKTGQLAILQLLAMTLGFTYEMYKSMGSFMGDKEPPVFFSIFFIIFVMQFILPAIFGIGYLSKLPVKGEGSSHFQQDDNIAYSHRRSINRMDSPMLEDKYKDAILPFGIFGTFMLILGLVMALLFMAISLFGENTGFIIIPAGILGLFAIQVIYNHAPSPFEENRNLVKSFTGGGSTFLFNGTWPFFRLMVYEDGLEVRVMFHRFFIPYDKIIDLPEKSGFFSLGLLIKSDLPGVPSAIRFHAFGMKRVVNVLNEMRGKSLASHME